MIKTIRYIDKGSYTLEIDTTSGRRVFRRLPKDGVEQPVRPGAIRRAANFGKAAVGHIKAGRPKASLAVVEERFAICQECPSRLYKVLEKTKIPKKLIKLKEVGTCLHKSCGCYLHPTEIKPSKLHWGDSRCPEGHWGKDA